MNFVEVREIDPPQGEQPVLWRLVTTEPIDTIEQIAAVIDSYRCRWIIDDFFKALKTGCRYQELQLKRLRVACGPFNRSRGRLAVDHSPKMDSSALGLINEM